MTDNKMKVALLCNSKLAMPALQRMAGSGVLAAVATPAKDAEIVAQYQQAANQYGAPYRKITAGNVAGQLAGWLEAVQPDAVFVITFPWRIAPEILKMPRLGFVNFHYGLLPEMRGADPIFESIRQRIPAAGVTVHLMDEGLDTGPVALREEFLLPADFTYGVLSGQMARVGEKLCGQLLAEHGTYVNERGGDGPSQADEPATTTGTPGMWNGLPLTRQDENKAKYWPKVGESDITIRWAEMQPGEIMALVRACNPIGKGAPTTVNGWKIAVTDISPVNLQGDASAIKPGAIIAMDQQNGLIVCCLGGTALKLEVVYCSEGYFPGYKLGFFGIQVGMVFG